ncbi:hypothetical protein Cfor_03968 [Coptotermes formosanus]|jgi:hypothetical protein|uniref:Uncharacterized protein n=1 Tax=Coptotermes formosanus TaxID=36987 RepID=A0A6L2PT59_COPFO|nr:hypothetical protein Cfor_03968 [Coptotermes formosanus]
MFKAFVLSFHSGIAEDALLGPYVLPPRLTGAVYHDLLRYVLPELLQDVALHTGVYFLFMHDRAPPHFLLAARKFLNNVFPTQGGPTVWTARFPDFSPFDFYLCDT